MSDGPEIVSPAQPPRSTLDRDDPCGCQHRQTGIGTVTTLLCPTHAADLED